MLHTEKAVGKRIVYNIREKMGWEPGQLRHYEIQLGIPAAAGRFIMQNDANRRVRMTRVCKDIEITSDASSQ